MNNLIKKIKYPFYLFKIGFKAVFHYPIYKLDVQDANYNNYWDEKSDGYFIGDWQKDRADIIKSVIKKEKVGSLADVGCGDGSVLAYLKKSIQGVEAIGLDTSEEALSRAKKRGIEVKRIEGETIETIRKLPNVDYIFFLEVLEHTANAEELLKAAYDKSKKGVFFSFPNTGFFIYRLRLLFGKFPAQWRVHPGEHLRFWTISDLRWWLRALNMNNYEIYTYRGIPILNLILPSLFAAGIVVVAKK